MLIDRMTDKEIISHFIQGASTLVDKWMREAYASIPPEYTERGLGRKISQTRQLRRGPDRLCGRVNPIITEVEHDRESK